MWSFDKALLLADHPPPLTYVFLIPLAVGAVLAYPILRGLIALKSRQTIYDLAPSTHQKKQGTPTMGGLIVLAGLFTMIFFLSYHPWAPILWLSGFALIGFADDFLVPRYFPGKRGLGWKQKIIGQLVLAFIGVWIMPLPLEPLVVAVGMFLILFFCNAYNFADGLDGLAGSLGVLLFLGFAALSPFANGSPELFVAPAGALIPFLFLNSPPAKVFMGDVGSLPLGALLGLGAITLVLDANSDVVTWTPQFIPALLVLSFIMIAELVPVPMQVAYYKLTKKRIFPMTPIHHAFEVKGWPESKVVWTFILTQAVLVVVAISLASHAVGQPK